MLNEVSDMQMKFFETYAGLNIRFRGIKEGGELEVHKSLRSHYEIYRLTCQKLGSDDLYSTVDKNECYKLDTEMSDIFSKYIAKEWGRAKKGDETIIARKNVVLIVLFMTCMWTGLSWISAELNRENTVIEVDEKRGG